MTGVRKHSAVIAHWRVHDTVQPVTSFGVACGQHWDEAVPGEFLLLLFDSDGDHGVPRLLTLDVNQAEAFALLVQKAIAQLKGEPIQ